MAGVIAHVQSRLIPVRGDVECRERRGVYLAVRLGRRRDYDIVAVRRVMNLAHFAHRAMLMILA